MIMKTGENKAHIRKYSRFYCKTMIILSKRNDFLRFTLFLCVRERKRQNSKATWYELRPHNKRVTRKIFFIPIIYPATAFLAYRMAVSDRKLIFHKKYDIILVKGKRKTNFSYIK